MMANRLDDKNKNLKSDELLLKMAKKQKASRDDDDALNFTL